MVETIAVQCGCGRVNGEIALRKRGKIESVSLRNPWGPASGPLPLLWTGPLLVMGCCGMPLRDEGGLPILFAPRARVVRPSLN